MTKQTYESNKNLHTNNSAQGKKSRSQSDSPVRDEAYFQHIPHEVAAYRPVKLPLHRDNPYVLALPELPSDEELMEALTRLPKFDPKDRHRSPAERIMLLNQLGNIFVATARHTRLLRGMLKLMIQGYEKRKPTTAEHRLRMQSAYREMQTTGSFRPVPWNSVKSQLSMGLAGAAGIGKTYTMRHIMSLLPPAIYHPLTGLWQLPFLFIEMPYDGESVHTLASSIFQEIDRLLPSENYSHTYLVRTRVNAETRLAMALNVAAELGVGMLIVDEQQNQKHIGNDPNQKRTRRPSAAVNLPRNETPLLKLLITASNNAHIPLCLTGTLESQDIVGARFTRARRMSGSGSALWLPLKPTFDMSEGKRGEFEELMKVLWKYQWVTNRTDITPKMHELFWRLTQGLPDMMVKLFSATQEAAIVSGAETLTLALFQATYDSQFWAAHLGLEALRKGDRVLTEAVPDIHHTSRSPAFRGEVLEALAEFRERNSMPMSKEEQAMLAQARATRDAGMKAAEKEQAAERLAARAASDMKRTVDAAMDSDEAAIAGTLARQSLLAGVNTAGPAKRA